MEIKKPLTLKKAFTYICLFIFVLIFISKISFKFIGVFPYSINPLIFQHGLHPFVNFFLQTIAFFALLFIWFRSKIKTPYTPLYSIYITLLLALLSLQTFFQIAFINTSFSALNQIMGLAMAVILITLYGVIIPSLFPIEKFVNFVGKFSATLVVLSVIFLPLFFGTMFRGGRFVGFFKHIPHMVSASTIAFIFLIHRPFQDKIWLLRKNKFLDILILFILAFAVLITFTKAAFVSIIIALITAVLALGSRKKSIRMFKFTFVASIIVIAVFVGGPISQLLYEVSSGQKSLGSRPAQDGIQTRMEEVTRGLKSFEKSPYFGNGLLYKFMGSQENMDVSDYNSFKDPHNLFISAGVIGGWPLLIMAVIGYFFMFIGAIKGLLSVNTSRKVLAIFLLAHLPVFVIYHAHFSLGGIGDRIYWLIFGYLGQTFVNRPDEL